MADAKNTPKDAPAEDSTVTESVTKSTTKAKSAPTAADALVENKNDPNGEAQDKTDGKTVVQRENTYTYREGQGNTAPSDFDVFDDRGRYVEKRDR